MQKKITFEDGPTSTLAAIIFHTLMFSTIELFVDFQAAMFYGVTALITTLIVHFVVFEGFIVGSFPSLDAGSRTSLPRVFTAPIMATANVFTAVLTLLTAIVVGLTADLFDAHEGSTYKAGLNAYESLSSLDLGLVKPESNDSSSATLYYIQEQLTSVLDISLLYFTLTSIVTIFAIEVITFFMYKAYKSKQ